MSTRPTLAATVTGADGFDTVYVDFQDLVDLDGALTGTPTVTSGDTNYIAVSGAAITFAGTLNGVTYAAGDVLTFVVTAQQEATTSIPITIVYQTPKRKETLRVNVDMKPYGT